MQYQCEYCESFNLKEFDDEMVCYDCACVQPRFATNDYDIRICTYRQIIKNTYYKKGVQQQIKTEYSNIIRKLNLDGDLEEIYEMINTIVGNNESLIEGLKAITKLHCKGLGQGKVLQEKQLSKPEFCAILCVDQVQEEGHPRNDFRKVQVFNRVKIEKDLLEKQKRKQSVDLKSVEMQGINKIKWIDLLAGIDH